MSTNGSVPPTSYALPLLLPPAPASPPSSSIMNSQLRSTSALTTDGVDNSEQFDFPPEVELSNTTRMISATIGALITSIVVTPFDVVKTRLQAQLHPLHQHSPDSSPLQAAQPQPVSNSHSQLHSHPNATSPYYRPLAISSPSGHLSSAALLDRCTHVRLQTGFVDTWCHRCTIIAPRPSTSDLLPVYMKYEPALIGGSQSQSQVFNGTWDACVKLVRNEGAGALWRGLSPQLLLSIPSTVVYFGAYDKLKLSIQNLLGSSSNPAYHSWLPYVTPLIAGTSARAITTVLVSPIELIRTRTQSLTHDASMWSIAKSEIDKGGVRSLWRGANPTLWRDVPFSAIYWSSYEAIKARMMQSLPQHIHTARMSGKTNIQQLYQNYLMWTAFCAGATSGILSAALTHPFDLVKTRRQIDMYSLIDSSLHSHSHASATTTLGVLRLIVREEGWMGLTSGLLPRISKIAPACAIMISTYEAAKAKFGHLNQQNHTSTGTGGSKPST